jgi:outer membrane autotransporter protein
MLLENGGSLTVLGGHKASDTTVGLDGVMHIKSGGSATGTTIDRGIQTVDGNAENTTVTGGTQTVNVGGTAINTILNQAWQFVSGLADKTTLNDGATQTVITGGKASNTTVNSTATQIIQAGASATDAILNIDGLQEILTNGNATGTIIDGGLQKIQGTADNTTLNAGYQQVSAGGIASNTTVNGGEQRIESGGSATTTLLNTHGFQNVLADGSATGTTIDGGVQNVSGSADNTTVNDGTQIVYAGGAASKTTLHNGGTQRVVDGGSVIQTTINSGGVMQVDAGGSAFQVTQNRGGAVVTNTSAVLSGTNDKGAFSITGGSASNMLLENDGYLTVFGGHEASDTTVGSNGTLDVRSGGVLRGTTTLNDKGVLVGDVVTNEGNLHFLNNTAAAFTGSLTGSGTLTQEGGNTRFSGLLSQDGGIALKNGGAMTMDALKAKANVTTQSGTTLTLDNGTILTGSVAGDATGAGDMAVKGASVWHLDGDSTVGALTLDNGTVDFRPSATTRLTPVFQAVSLALGSLSGNGTFRMNTDIASYTGDMLKVTGNASGNFVLDIKNTGREPVSAGAPLQVVQTGGGDAAFTLKGGKVDAGTWEYGLNKENTNWYLKANTPPPVTQPSTPGTGNPGTGNPDAGNPGAGNTGAGNTGAGKPDAGTSSSPVRRTTKSADAVLGMATAPAYVFNSELDNLRFRHGDVMQNTGAPGGVWGRYTGSENRITGGASSGYTLTQNGFETGADKVFDLGESSLAVGTFFSYSDNSIKHARGGKSKVDSTGGGLYATWFDNDGYYVDGVLKYNRFNNELRTWMSDGTAVKGDYSQNGFGGSLEAGRTFSLNENAWAQPYVRTTAFKADAKDISLNNGMKAKTGATKSVQAEAGVKLGMTLDVGGKEVKPYLSAAVSHEFSDNNKVRINDTYDFRNDISGTTGKYGLGVSAQLTPNAGVWAEARYENGKQTESPVTASVGFRFNF